MSHSSLTYRYQDVSPLPFLNTTWQNLAPVELVDIGAPRLVDASLMQECDVLKGWVVPQDIQTICCDRAVGLAGDNALISSCSQTWSIIGSLGLSDEYLAVLSPFLRRLRSISWETATEITETHCTNALDFALWANPEYAAKFVMSGELTNRVDNQRWGKMWKYNEPLTALEFDLRIRGMGIKPSEAQTDEIAFAIAFDVPDVFSSARETMKKPGQSVREFTGRREFAEIVDDHSALAWAIIHAEATRTPGTFPPDILTLAKHMRFRDVYPYLYAGIYHYPTVERLFNEGISPDFAVEFAT